MSTGPRSKSIACMNCSRLSCALMVPSSAMEANGCPPPLLRHSAPSEAKRDYISRVWACTYNIVACKEPAADNFYALADVHDPSK
eukprot:scaffold286334_cov26-Tisochrysis_lutea.AAC.1